MPSGYTTGARSAVYVMTCSECGQSREKDYHTWHRYQKRGTPYVCVKCSYALRAKNRSEMFRSMSEEERNKVSSKARTARQKYLSTLSDDEKMRLGENMKVVRDNYMASLSVEDRDAHYTKLRKAASQYHKEMSDEERAKRLAMSKDAISHYHNMLKDPGVRAKLGERQRKRFENMTEKQKRERMETIWAGRRKWKETMTDEEREVERTRISKVRAKWYTSLTENDKIQLRESQLRPGQLRKRTVFADKFVRMFNESYLVNDFKLTPEYVMSNNNVVHTWDFGIFNLAGELICLVDLDGRFFHADNNDYNGLHCREEFDEKRFLSTPAGILCHVIYEEDLKRSFENLIKLIKLDYNEFVETQFKYCRSAPFPYPTYTEDALHRSYRQLCLLDCDKKHLTASTNNREGDRLINHFHHAIYSARRDKKSSPYEAWYDDDTLRSVIANRIIYVNTLNPNKILQGFNISRIAPKVSVFSAGRAKLLIHRYLHDFDTIFDPFSGFSGRMLGAVSLGKKYIGQDISPIHVRESNEIIRFINMSDRVSINQADILQSSGEYECLFTCPPYGAKEQWHEVQPDFRTCDNWIDECLSRFKCKRYLFVVDTTEKYQEYIRDEIVNKSHWGNVNEYIICI